MSPGDVILARLQLSDGQLKVRPPLVLAIMPPFRDLLIAAVSSKLRHRVEGFDEVLDREDADFGRSGLRVTSLVRLGMVTTIPGTAALGALGSISPERLARSRGNLARHLKEES